MSITVRNMTIGCGIPKIAVPIVEKTETEILRQAGRIADSCADLAEWRVDFYEKMTDPQAVAELIAKLKGTLGEKLLLYTCRTKAEGGQADCAPEEYRQIVFSGMGECSADLIDAEFSAGEDFVRVAAERARACSGALVASYHNFQETPSDDFLAEKFRRMAACGADILKIAVMPRSTEDTERMMEITKKISEETEKPLLGIAMGELGKISRYTGERFGSCITFGTIGASSAPGQIQCGELKSMMQTVHEER